MYIERKTKLKDLLNTLSQDLQNAGWVQEQRREPAGAFTRNILVMKYQSTPVEGESPNPALAKFVLFERENNSISGIKVQVGSAWDTTTSLFPAGSIKTSPYYLDWKPYKDIVETTLSPKQSPASAPDGTTATWYEQEYSITENSVKGFGNDTIIYYYLNANANRMVLSCESDPALGLTYDRRVSWLYLGKIVPFSKDDITGNFAITVGCNYKEIQMGSYDMSKWDTNQRIAKKQYDEVGYTRPDTYGLETATAQDDILMWETSSGLLHQRHYPSVVTHRDDINISRFNSSNWTDDYYLSPIYVAHGEDGFRGYLDGVMAIHKHSIVHRDELIVTEMVTEMQDDGDGGQIPVEVPKTKNYKFFDINVEKSILQTLANRNMGIVFATQD